MHPIPVLLRRGVQDLVLRSGSRVVAPAAARTARTTAAPVMPQTVSGRAGLSDVWTRSYTKLGAPQAAPAPAALAPTQQRRHTSSSSSAASLPVLPPSILAEALLPTASSPLAAAGSSTPSSQQLPAEATATAAATADATNAHPTVYATVLLHGRPYLVTPGDRLRLPFRMPDVRPGDELRLDRVGVVGSRTLTAVPAVAGGRTTTQGGALVQHQGYVPGASVRAVVLGVEAEPLREMVKTKRRNRRNRTVRSKHQYTVLRIQEVVLGGAAGETAATA